MPPPAPSVPEQCSTCKFTKLLSNGRRACRRYPPSNQPPGRAADQAPDEVDGLVFTTDDWWCGEWKKQ